MLSAKLSGRFLDYVTRVLLVPSFQSEISVSQEESSEVNVLRMDFSPKPVDLIPCAVRSWGMDV